jgi:hypothetical protein
MMHIRAAWGSWLGRSWRLFSTIVVVASALPALPAGPAQAPPAYAAPATQGGAILEDGLTDNRTGWPVGTHRYFTDAGYVIRHESNDPSVTSFMAIPKVQPVKDVVVEATMKLDSAPGIGWHGVALRTSPGHGYRLVLNRRGGFALDRLQDSGWAEVIPARSHRAVKPIGEANVIRLVASGDTLNVFINEHHVANVKDAGIESSGGAALVVGGGQQVTVRQVRVRAPGEHDIKALPRPAMLFEDMFFDNRSRWSLREDAPELFSNFIDEVGYHLWPAQEGPATLWHFRPGASAAATMAADVAAEMDVTLKEGEPTAAYGLSVRWTGDSNYTLLISGDRNFALRKVSGGRSSWPVDWKPTAMLRPAGHSNLIRLVAFQNTLTVFLNDQPVAHVVDPEPLPVGQMSMVAEEGVHAAVRRLSVWRATEEDVSKVDEPAVLFYDELRNNLERWPETAGRFYFAPDGYHIDASNEVSTSLVPSPLGTPQFSGVSVRADIQVIKASQTSAFGVGVRVLRNPRQGYRVLINADGHFTVLRLDEDGDTTLVPWQVHRALRTGASINSVRLSVRGNTLSVLLNNQPAALLEDELVLGRGNIQLVALPGAHVAVRRISAVEPADEHFLAPPVEQQRQPVPPQMQPTPAQCLPAVESSKIEPFGVRAQVVNPCGAEMQFGLGFVLLDKPDGQPLAVSGTVRWRVPAGDRRELFVPVSASGATATVALRTGVPLGQEQTWACEVVTGTVCLPVDPQLRTTVQTLIQTEAGRALARSAAEAGVTVASSMTQAGSLGVFQPSSMKVTLGTRLDAYSDWERAAVLAHELQHAVDAASGKAFRSRADCLAREGDAFKREGEVWRALWRSRLPTPQNSVQELLNDLTRRAQDDPAALSAQVSELYAHQCGTQHEAAVGESDYEDYAR